MKIFKKIGKPNFIDILISLVVVGTFFVIVLAILNPLEKIRRREDLETQNSAEKLAKALQGYKSASSSYPWEVTSLVDTPTKEDSKPKQSWLEILENENYLEQGLKSKTNLKEYLVINTLPDKVCYYPQSTQYRQFGKYDESGVNECLPEGFTPCFVCFDY